MARLTPDALERDVREMPFARRMRLTFALMMGVRSPDFAACETLASSSPALSLVPCALVELETALSFIASTMPRAAVGPELRPRLTSTHAKRRNSKRGPE